MCTTLLDPPPAWVHITWGAGGSTHERSLELCEALQKDLGIDTCLHLTCTNMEKQVLDDALDVSFSRRRRRRRRRVSKR